MRSTSFPLQVPVTPEVKILPNDGLMDEHVLTEPLVRQSDRFGDLSLSSERKNLQRKCLMRSQGLKDTITIPTVDTSTSRSPWSRHDSELSSNLEVGSSCFPHQRQALETPPRLPRLEPRERRSDGQMSIFHTASSVSKPSKPTLSAVQQHSTRRISEGPPNEGDMEESWAVRTVSDTKSRLNLASSRKTANQFSMKTHAKGVDSALSPSSAMNAVKPPTESNLQTLMRLFAHTNKNSFSSFESSKSAEVEPSLSLPITSELDSTISPSHKVETPSSPSWKSSHRTFSDMVMEARSNDVPAPRSAERYSEAKANSMESVADASRRNATAVTGRISDFQSPSSGTFLNKNSYGNFDAHETLRRLLDCLSQLPSSNDGPTASAACVLQGSVNLNKPRAEDLDQTTGKEESPSTNEDRGGLTAVAPSYLEHAAGDCLSPKDGFSSLYRGAMTAPAALTHHNADSLLRNLLNSLNCDDSGDNGRQSFGNTFEDDMRCGRKPQQESFAEPSMNKWSSYDESDLHDPVVPRHESNAEMTTGQVFVNRVSNRPGGYHNDNKREDHTVNQGLHRVRSPEYSNYGSYFSKANGYTGGNVMSQREGPDWSVRTDHHSGHFSSVRDQSTRLPMYPLPYYVSSGPPPNCGIVEHGMSVDRDATLRKIYTDDRDRMVYVSWIPKKARAYNTSDKRRMELDFKRRLREDLGLPGLTKVLLFPPKGVHCKLIFDCRRSASNFMEVYGGDNRSTETERWKVDLCRIYEIDMHDRFDKTVVKIEWSQK